MNLQVVTRIMIIRATELFRKAIGHKEVVRHLRTAKYPNDVLPTGSSRSTRPIDCNFNCAASQPTFLPWAQSQVVRWKSSKSMGQNLDDNGHKKKCKYEITLEELSDLIDSGEVNLVDVREPYELRDNGTIPKAVNIPLKHLHVVLQLPPEDFKNIFKRDKPGKDEDIIFSCAAGTRSKLAMETAEAVGYTKARHYPGGWQEWSRMKTVVN